MTGTPAKIRFIAIDDNPLDLLSISEYSKPYPFLQNCGSFTTALEGYEAVQYIKTGSGVSGYRNARNQWD